MKKTDYPQGSGVCPETKQLDNRALELSTGAK
jgi:hypothetical protein